MRSFEPAHQLRSPRGAAARMVWPLVIALPVVLGGCASIVIHDRPIFDQHFAGIPIRYHATSRRGDWRSFRLAWHWTRNIPNGQSRTTATPP